MRPKKELLPISSPPGAKRIVIVTPGRYRYGYVIDDAEHDDEEDQLRFARQVVVCAEELLQEIAKDGRFSVTEFDLHTNFDFTSTLVIYARNPVCLESDMHVPDVWGREPHQP